jgi:outer membrane protein assembly factor BamA
MSEIAFLKFPDKFCGIGNNTSDDMEEDYTPRTMLLKMNFQKKIYAVLRVGAQYEFNKNEIIEVEENGLLAKNQIVGSEGGTSSGIGILVNWDNRDNIFYAKRGGFYQISSIMYKNALKSDYEFTQYNLDLRHYFSILPSHTLALQGLFNLMTGDIPFQKLSLLGGQNVMRGYYLGRYRDKKMMVFQIEYRVTPV